ncbi:hypothetical protein OG562_19660 [Streptomyces sp. NBC_01275]|nr:hypothetical protein [Streptomyces sp. NBC_01275]MCX4763158.1 hypothetical protein [Streptomyces sp. NBC_01275]
MSFHKIAPVKKARKTAPAPVAKPVAKKKAAPKVTPKRRPVSHKD